MNKWKRKEGKKRKQVKTEGGMRDGCKQIGKKERKKEMWICDEMIMKRWRARRTDERRKKYFKC